MPKSLKGETFLLTNEVAAAVGISKPTLLRWINEGRVKDSDRRDRNGWRLFSAAEVSTIRRYADSGESGHHEKKEK